eukprot:364745-Chlamydomonas_euryale.AAC.11
MCGWGTDCDWGTWMGHGLRMDEDSLPRQTSSGMYSSAIQGGHEEGSGRGHNFSGLPRVAWPHWTDPLA